LTTTTKSRKKYILAYLSIIIDKYHKMYILDYLSIIIDNYHKE